MKKSQKRVILKAFMKRLNDEVFEMFDEDQIDHETHSPVDYANKAIFNVEQAKLVWDVMNEVWNKK